MKSVAMIGFASNQARGLPRRAFADTHRFVALLCAAVLVAALPVRAGQVSDIATLVPQDAWGFFVVKSMNDLDAKAAQIKEALGLSFPTPVSTFALSMLNLGDTLDADRPICAIMMDVDKFGGPDKAAVVLLPAKNIDALLEQLTAEKGEGGLYNCQLMGEAAFAGKRGDVLVLGPNQDCVTKVLKSKKAMSDGLAAARSEAIDKSDLYLSISLGSIVSTYKDRFLPMIQMMAAATDPEGKGIAKFAKRLEEIAAFDIGARVSDDGVSLTVLSHPKKGSDLEKMTADERSTDESLLKVLAKEKYLAALGWTILQSEHRASFDSDTPITDIVKMTQAVDLDEESVKNLEKELMKLRENMDQIAMSVNALGGGDEGLIGVSLVARTKDSKKFVDGLRRVYKVAWKLSDNEEVSAIRKACNLKEEAETLAGNKVDNITVDFAELKQAGHGSQKDAKKFETLFGKGCRIRFGAADAKHVVLTMGGGGRRYEALCGAIGADGDPLSTDTGITAISKKMFNPRVFEGFVAVDHIFQTIKAATQAMGEEEEFPFDAPTLNAPVGLCRAVRGEVDCMEMVIPMKLILAVKEGYEKYAKASEEESFDEGEDEEAADEDSAVNGEDAPKAKDAAGEEEDDSSEDEGDE